AQGSLLERLVRFVARAVRVEIVREALDVTRSPGPLLAVGAVEAALVVVRRPRQVPVTDVDDVQLPCALAAPARRDGRLEEETERPLAQLPRRDRAAVFRRELRLLL